LQASGRTQGQPAPDETEWKPVRPSPVSQKFLSEIAAWGEWLVLEALTLEKNAAGNKS
jgi:hypothetical protein